MYVQINYKLQVTSLYEKKNRKVYLQFSSIIIC